MVENLPSKAVSEEVSREIEESIGRAKELRGKLKSLDSRLLDLAGKDAKAEQISGTLLKALDRFESWRASRKRLLMQCLVREVTVSSKVEAKVVFTLPLTALPKQKPGSKRTPVLDEKPLNGVPTELLAGDGIGSPLGSKWLPRYNGKKNVSSQEGSGSLRQSQEVSGVADLCHEIPVAVTRLAHGKGILTHEDEAPTPAKAIRRRPKREISVIAVARELQEALEQGEAGTQSELARQRGMNRVRVTQFLNLLKLATGIQNYLLKTKDKGGKIGERQLRPLVQIVSKRDQTVAFRKML